MNQRKFILILFALLISSACRTRKESTYTQNRLEALVHGQHAIQWQQADNNLRYWYYQSDSAFYYHPDSGLYASSGRLAIEEKRFKNTFGQVQRDSSFYLQSQQYAGQEKSVTKDRSKLWLYVIGVGVLLVVGVGFYVAKRVLF